MIRKKPFGAYPRIDGKLTEQGHKLSTVSCEEAWQLAKLHHIYVIC